MNTSVAHYEIGERRVARYLVFRRFTSHFMRPRSFFSLHDAVVMQVGDQGPLCSYSMLAEVIRMQLLCDFCRGGEN